MGMRVSIDRTEPFHADTRVYLGGRQRRVPQHLLYNSDIRPVVQQVSCKGMAKPVGSKVLPQSYFLQPSDDNVGGTPRGKPSTTEVENERLLIPHAPAHQELLPSGTYTFIAAYAPAPKKT